MTTRPRLCPQASCTGGTSSISSCTAHAPHNLALSALRSDFLSATVGYPAVLRAVEPAFPDVLGDFVSAHRVWVPFLLHPVAVSEPLWVGRRATVAAFLCAVADATCARSQCSFPPHVLPPPLALRRLLNSLLRPTLRPPA